MNNRERRVAFVLAVGAATALVLAGMPLGSGGERGAAAHGGGRKLSSLLQLQVDVGLGRVSNPVARAVVAGAGTGNPQGRPERHGPSAAGSLLVVVRACEPPDAKFLCDLHKVGARAYEESWIPPVGRHEMGFFLAEVPVQAVEGLGCKDYVVELDSAERMSQPQNDLGAEATRVCQARVQGYDGSGVRVAILDSGLDVDHPDIPAPVACKDFSGYPEVDDCISNMVTGHGTHVTGSLVGSGKASDGRYRGMVPGADLVFLKIGNDHSSGASTAAVVAALKAAVDTYDADVINVSYSGWGLYHDGSSLESQAIDYAASKGAVVCVSAGNYGDARRHYSGTVPARGMSEYIPVIMGPADIPFYLLWFNLVYDDGMGVSNDLDLHYYDGSFEALDGVTRNESESLRGTESELSHYSYIVGPGTYYLRVENNSDIAQEFHIYEWTGWSPVTFQNPDPEYTVGLLADADGAVAAGAYTTRDGWVDYSGCTQEFDGREVGAVTGFSSRGPRVDGRAKPDVVAPGSAVVSCRDTDMYTWPSDLHDKYIVDNDGLNLDGSGPADYYVMEGTSMAAPMAAGAAALLLEARPELKGNPTGVARLLRSTASLGQWPDEVSGHGAVDAMAALTSRKGDINSDGSIDLADFVALAAAFGRSCGEVGFTCLADFDDDAEVDLADFISFAAVYGT